MYQRRFFFILFCVAAIVIIAFFIRKLSMNFNAPSERASVDAAGDVETALPVVPPKPRYKSDIPPASEENNLLKLAENAVGTDGKVCYLTFDDGPTEAVTPQVLEVLKQYDVKATFFMVGKMIDNNRELARRVYNEGHLLANHSYDHDYNALYASGESFITELEKTSGIIEDVTGEKPFKLMRFPGGSYNAGDHAAEKQQYKALLKRNGYYYADWNCLNGDAEGSSRTAEQLITRVQQTATAKNIVVLMHDAATKKTTAEALPAIIEYLRGQGYEFRRLDEVDYYDNAEEAKTSSEAMVL